MPNLTLPGFNYLGPGNPLDNGEPTNNADRIARDHDIEYSTATSPEDIRRSDRKAIIRFLGDRDLFGPSIGGTIGAIGIGAKYALESVTGVLYPSLQRTTGSTIFFKNQGKSYTWKSPQWTTATKYGDLNIYNNPNSLPEKKPMDQWKEASFRAKVLIGTPHSNADRTLKIHRTLETLKTLLIAEANTDPNCVAQVKE